MSKPKILAFAGSARKESYNKQLIRVAADAAIAAGGDVTLIDLADYPLPIYDGDFEEEHGIPGNAKKLKQLFVEHQGLMIACPEYNSSITPLLKNTIDWVSRREEGEEPLVAYKGKVLSLLSASPGALGGLRGLVHVRSIFGNIGTIVLPEQLAVSKGNEAFNADGSLKDAQLQSKIAGIARQLVEVAGKLQG